MVCHIDKQISAATLELPTPSFRFYAFCWSDIFLEIVCYPLDHSGKILKIFNEPMTDMKFMQEPCTYCLVLNFKNSYEFPSMNERHIFRNRNRN